MDEGFQSEQKRKGTLEQKREYGCPCGKTYLSYPALFTHVKQKHNGKPPGDLIKPKKQKPRGRPKIHLDVMLSIIKMSQNNPSDQQLSLEEEIEKILFGVKIKYNEKFETSEGTETCQDMATSFLQQLSRVQAEGKKVLHCFLNEIKETVDRKFGQKFWYDEKPTEIIELANQVCMEHKNRKQKFPLENQVLVELLFVLFRWMYNQKWTDHKLVKKSQSNSE